MLYGKETGGALRQEVADRVEEIRAAGGTVPGLAVVVVGENPASRLYVRSKRRACKRAGLYSRKVALPGDTTREALLKAIADLNHDPLIHGILVQLPLPPHIDSQEVLQTILPIKDVDGFHPENVGRLHIGLPCHKPCTPAGVMELLKRYEIDCTGKQAAVIGRSNIVGKPMASLLTEANATVTVCHSRTSNIEAIVGEADILVSAIGLPNFVKGAWIKQDAVVVDVGQNTVDGVLLGDIEYDEASTKASYITPVPGGVGPMTVAILLQNTLRACSGM